MIYIVRHGETDANITNTIRGSYFDDDLNAAGREQAKATAEQLKGIHFDICFCSPLKRSLQTCEPIFSGEIILDKRLLPRDYGELIKLGETSDWLDKNGYWNRDLNHHVKNGETVRQTEMRIKGFLDETMNKYTGRNVLIVAHGSIMSLMKGILDNFSRGAECRLYKTANCEIVKIEN